MMSGEIESVGGLVTGGLVAKAFDADTSKAGDLQRICPNCATPIEGNFCRNCGQNAHLPRSIGHIFEELLHGVLHFDSRGWRTLPMLAFRPGTLTREYVGGKRARYIPPFALFLFTVFVMYFTFAFLAPVDLSDGVEVDMSPADIAELEASVVEQRQAIAGLERRKTALETAKARTPGDTGRLAGEIGAHKISIAMMEKAIARAKEAKPSTSVKTKVDGKANVVTAPDWRETLATAAADPNVVSIDGAPGLEGKIRAALRNPDLVFYKMQQSAYKFSFLLVPLSLPFVWLLFPFRRNTHLYDHAVFTLYSLSFMSLLFVVLAIITSVGLATLDAVAPAAVFIPPLHMFVHLKGAYRLGWFGALVRTVLLGTFAIVVLGVFFIIIMALGALG